MLIMSVWKSHLKLYKCTHTYTHTHTSCHPLCVHLDLLSHNMFHRHCMLYIVTPQAACRHVAKCRVLGAQFCNWNPMTERMEFLHLTATTRDVFAKSWAIISEKKLMQEGEKVEDLEQGEKVEDLKQGEKGKNLVEDLKQGENGKRKSAPEAEQDGKVDKDKNKNKKAKNLLDLLFGKAIQSKNLYLKVTGQAAALLEQVTSDPEFEWASQAILSPVHTAQHAVAKQVDQFTLMLVTGTGINQIKLKFNDQEHELEDKLRGVCLIDSYLKQLDKEVDIIKKMHAARTSS